MPCDRCTKVGVSGPMRSRWAARVASSRRYMPTIGLPIRSRCSGSCQGWASSCTCQSWCPVQCASLKTTAKRSQPPLFEHGQGQGPLAVVALAEIGEQPLDLVGGAPLTGPVQVVRRIELREAGPVVAPDRVRADERVQLAEQLGRPGRRRPVAIVAPPLAEHHAVEALDGVAVGKVEHRHPAPGVAQHLVERGPPHLDRVGVARLVAAGDHLAPAVVAVAVGGQRGRDRRPDRARVDAGRGDRRDRRALGEHAGERRELALGHELGHDRRIARVERQVGHPSGRGEAVRGRGRCRRSGLVGGFRWWRHRRRFGLTARCDASRTRVRPSLREATAARSPRLSKGGRRGSADRVEPAARPGRTRRRSAREPRGTTATADRALRRYSTGSRTKSGITRSVLVW